MKPRRDLKRQVVAAGLVLAIPILASAAPTVWVGGGPNDVTFAKTGGADPTLPTNQDAITPDVHLTRGSSGGLYNTVSEASFVRGVSPADTEWAFSGLHGNGTFAYGDGAADYANWTYADFTTALESSVGNNVIDTPGVLHLITDDVYLDIVITTWSTNRPPSGGVVTYTRAPEPATMALLALGAVAMMKRRRRE